MAALARVATKGVEESRGLQSTLVGHADVVTTVTLSPDGRFALSGSEDNTVKLWEVATGKNIATLKGHKEGIAELAFSPDGKTLASGSAGSEDASIKVWDLHVGKRD